MKKTAAPQTLANAPANKNDVFTQDLQQGKGQNRGPSQATVWFTEINEM